MGERDIAKVDRGSPSRRLDLSCGELVADEQFVDDELDLLGIEIDVAAPTSVRSRGKRGASVSTFGVEVGTACSTACFAGFWASKFCTSQAPSNLAVAEIAGEARFNQLPAEQSAAITHRILAVARPAQYESGDPATMMGPNNSARIAASIINGPAGLAVSDHAGLAIGVGMQGD